MQTITVQTDMVLNECGSPGKFAFQSSRIGVNAVDKYGAVAMSAFLTGRKVRIFASQGFGCAFNGHGAKGISIE
ncbi:hypothetical protein OAS86_06455 [Gammaproteobacteria bacterium]|nr:hypothetical protein [Gammaproteobacteria bacterium]